MLRMCCLLPGNFRQCCWCLCSLFETRECAICGSTGTRQCMAHLSSEFNSIPRQDMVRLAVMRWVLRFLDPAAANTPDPNSSNPSTCAQRQWCVRDVCVSNASFSIPASDRLLRCFEHVQSRCKSNKKSSMPDWHDEAES